MRRVTFGVILLLLVAGSASAQQLKPIAPFALDIRGFWSGLGQDPVTAEALSVAATDLPSRGLGVAAGLNVYPFRRGGFAIGIGGEAALARGRAQQLDVTTGEPVGLAITQRLQNLSGQVSLNFGHRNGWSYVSAGMGPLSFATYQGDTAPVDPPLRVMTPNFGAGARWFSNNHLAFCFDIRFYQTTPVEAANSYPPRERTRLLIMSAGISLK